MKHQHVEPTNESLAKSLNMQEDFIRAASLSDEQKKGYAAGLNKSAKAEKWIGGPAAILVCAALGATLFMKGTDGYPPKPVTAVFAVAALGMVAGRILNRKGQIESEIRKAGNQNLLEFYRSNTMKPD